jgi:hypothetical protein
MLEKEFIAYVLHLALNYTGNPPLPADFPVPDVEFITREALISKSCEYRTAEQLPECLKFYDDHKIVGLYDRFHPKIYIVSTLESKIKNRDPVAVGVLLHESVHVVQTHYKHHDNPIITEKELQEDEDEAYKLERRFVKSQSQR